MATPSRKNHNLAISLDEFTAGMFNGRTRTTSILNNICVTCGEDALFNHRDRCPSRESIKYYRNTCNCDYELSKKEFTISGMCQKCQDSVFNTEDENYDD